VDVSEHNLLASKYWKTPIPGGNDMWTIRNGTLAIVVSLMGAVVGQPAEKIPAVGDAA
jgi:hypothetical protein